MGWQGEWLGIDEDGHVAELRFNDAGVAPRVFLEWCASRNPFVAPDARPRFEGAAPCTSVSDLADELPAPKPFRFFANAGSPFFPVFGAGNHAKAGTREVVVWVHDDAPVADDLRAKRAKRLATTEDGILVSYADYPAATRKRLHGKGGACRACLASMWLDEYLAAARGVFVYENEYAELNGPYVCRAAPAVPLEVESLSNALRARLARTKLVKCSFATSPRIQPAHHLPCDSTNSRASYLVDFDGITVRPIPGREDSFRPRDWQNVEGPTGSKLVVGEALPAAWSATKTKTKAKTKTTTTKARPEASPRRTLSEQVFASARTSEARAKQRYALAVQNLELRVGPKSRRHGGRPFILLEVLLSAKRRCFMGEIEDLDHASRAIVGADEAFEWLDAGTKKAWRAWRRVTVAAEVERVFRALAGDVVPGTANPFGAP